MTPGASFSPEASIGDRVVLPVLDAKGIDRIDALVLSHARPRRPTVAGSPAIDAALPVDRVYSSFDVATVTGAAYACRNFIAWRLGRCRIPLPPSRITARERQRQFLRAANPRRGFQRAYYPAISKPASKETVATVFGETIAQRPAHRRPPRQQYLLNLALSSK